MKKRVSNFELMRIISMLFIVTTHIFSWGGVMNASSYEIQKIIYFIYAIISIHVNSFVLVTGYFQSKAKFKISKVIRLLLIMWFYKATLTIIGYKLGWFTLSKFELLWNISPFDLSNYWFIKLYIVLYCLSPFINKMIAKLNRVSFRRLLIVMFFFCSVVMTLTNYELFNNAKGFSLVNFVLLYLIGAYIRKYVINERTKEKVTGSKERRRYFIIFVICFLINYCIFRIGNHFTVYDGVYKFFGDRVTNFFIAYDNPLLIIGAVAYFMFFGLINVKNRIINFISHFTLEIYIITETALFRPILYGWFHLEGPFDSKMILLKVLVVAIIIFISCLGIAWIRTQLCKLIGYFSSKIKVVKKFQQKLANIETRVNEWMNV